MNGYVRNRGKYETMKIYQPFKFERKKHREEAVKKGINT